MRSSMTIPMEKMDQRSEQADLFDCLSRLYQAFDTQAKRLQWDNNSVPLKLWVILKAWIYELLTCLFGLNTMTHEARVNFSHRISRDIQDVMNKGDQTPELLVEAIYEKVTISLSLNLSEAQYQTIITSPKVKALTHELTIYIKQVNAPRTNQMTMLLFQRPKKSIDEEKPVPVEQTADYLVTCQNKLTDLMDDWLIALEREHQLTHDKKAAPKSSNNLYQQLHDFLSEHRSALSSVTTVDALNNWVKQLKKLHKQFHPDKNSGSWIAHDITQKINKQLESISELLDDPKTFFMKNNWQARLDRLFNQYKQQMAEQLQQLQLELERMFAAQKAKIARLKTQLDGIDKRVDQLETQLDGKGKQTDQLKTQINERGNRVDQLETQINERDNRVDQLEAQMQGMCRMMQQIQNQLLPQTANQNETNKTVLHNNRHTLLNAQPVSTHAQESGLILENKPSL